jgi:hypothetical protein
MERLLYRPLFANTKLYLPNEKRPALVPLPSIVCRPRFSSGSSTYNCTYPLALPLHALKELLDESDLELVVELALRAVRLTPADARVRLEGINASRRQTRLALLTEEDVSGGAVFEEDEEEKAMM